MKSNDLNTIWIDIDVQKNARDRFLQRMVYVDLLYRAYIGASGIPSKRFLSIEIPEKDTNQFDTFTVPQGFTLSLGNPGLNMLVMQLVFCRQQAVTKMMFLPL